jgi:hypothetical protein
MVRLLRKRAAVGGTDDRKKASLISIVQRSKATDSEIRNPVDMLTIVIESLEVMQAALVDSLNSICQCRRATSRAVRSSGNMILLRRTHQNHTK